MSALKAVFAALCLLIAQVQVSTANSAGITISFESGTISVQEGQQLQLCVNLVTELPGGLPSPLTVTIQIFTTSPADLSQTSPVQVTFNTGDGVSGSSTVLCNGEIGIVDDQESEGPETFSALIAEPSSCRGPPSFVTVTITDNDNDPRISLDMASYMGAEGNSVTVCAVLSNVMGGTTTADISTTFTITPRDGAVQNADFSFPDPTELNVNFPAMSVNDATDCLTISILDDDGLEGDQILDVTLEQPAPPVTLGSPSSSPVTITDDEAFSLQMPMNVMEGNPVTIGLQLPSGGLEVDLNVTFSVIPGTASTEDFIEPPSAVTFTSGTPFGGATIMIDTVNDSIAEGVENFMVSIDSTSPTVTVGSPSSVTATIIDDDLDEVRIGMVLPMDSVEEGGGMINVCAQILSLPDVLQTNLVVDVTTSNTDGKAVVGQDFTSPPSPSLTFNSGDDTSTTRCVTFVIMDDDSLEFDHEFTVSLSDITPAGPVLATTSMTTVTIIDDEAANAAIQMVNPMFSVAEDVGVLPVCAEITGGVTELECSVETTATIAGGPKAENGTDFDAPSLVFNFEVGTDTTACINVTIIDDTNLEGTDSFTVSLGGTITPDLMGGFGRDSSSTIAILDSEATSSTIQMMTDAVSVDEDVGFGFVRVCAEITGVTGLECAVEAQASVTGSDKAVSGTDFTAPSLVFSFEVGENTIACIDITIENDMDLEGDHSFTVAFGSMSIPDLIGGFGSPMNTTVTIQDPEDATVSLQVNTPSVAEGDSFEVIIDLTTSGMLDCPLVVNLDFPGSFSVTFPAQSTTDTMTVMLPISDDEIAEDDQEITVAIESTDPPVTLGTASQNVTILASDLDSVGIEMVVESTSVSETDGTISVCAVLMQLPVGGLETDLVVTLSSFGSPKAVVDVDFTAPSPEQVIFSSGDVAGTQACNTYVITDDNNLEFSHEFTVSLLNVTPTGPNLSGLFSSGFFSSGLSSSGSFSSTTVTITDDEEDALISMQNATLMVSEGSSIEVCAVINGVTDVEEAVAATLTLAGSSKAVLGMDFGSGSMDTVARFPVGPLMPGCITVDINQDMSVEGDHTFSVSLDMSAITPLLTVGTPNTTVVTITDDINDTVTISFTEGVFSASEGEPPVSICAVISDLMGTLHCDLVVTFVGAPSDKAVVGDDYSNSPGDVFEATFMAGSTEGSTACDSITIVDDDDLEGPHSFAIHIIGSTPSGSQIITNTAFAMVEIQDNDDVGIIFQEPDFSATEGESPVSICAEISDLTGTLECDVVVTFAGASGDKAIEGDDYTISPGDVFEATFTAGSTEGSTACDSITIVDDDDLEGPHSFAIHIIGSTPSGSQIITNTAFAMVEIQDNDAASVALEQNLYSAVEGGMVEVCVVISDVPAGDLECPILASLSAIAGKAVEGADYELPDPFEVTFDTMSVDGSSACIDISIPQDSALEGDHGFTVLLSTLSPDVVTMGSPGSAEIVIADDENATISLTPPELTVEEGSDVNSVTVCVMISNLPAGGLQCDLVATLTPMEETAVAGEDYNAAPLQVVIPASMMDDDITVCVNKSVMVIDDHIVEFPENFTIQLTGSTPPVEIGAVNSATVTIVDDDKVTIGLEMCQYTVIEGGSQNICGTLDGYLQRPVTVYLSINSSSSSLRFGSMASPFNSIVDETVCVEYIAADNDIKEDTEQLTLRLMSHDNFVCLCRDFGTLSVFEDATDGVVLSFVETDYTVDEDAGVQRVCVELTGELETSISVTVDTQPNTALVGEDFVQIWQTLVFDGSTNTTQCVYVPIINDDCVEDGPEVFTATLRSDDDCVSFGASSTTIRIFDDDYVTIGFGQSDITVDEDEGAAHISVVIKCDCVRRDVEVNVLTEAGTATADSDYSTISTALTFTPSEPNQGVYITILEDTTLEDPENFFVHLETSDANVKLQHNYSAITIRDNDGVELSFVETDYTVDEDEGVQHVCVELTGELETSISVTVDTQPNTALVGEDFVQIWQTLVFDGSTNTTQCVYVPIINDDCVEDGPEVFTATLRSDDDRISFGANSTTIHIFDDDYVTIGFGQSDITVDEDEGAAHISVVIKCDCVRRDVEVNVFTAAGTATADSDYSTISTALTFTPSEPNQGVYITILEDTTLEDPENFFVHLETSDANVKLQHNYSAITIRDNDGAELSFVETDYTVDEDEGVQHVCVELTGELETSISVTVDTQPNTALVGEDFVQIWQTLVFDGSTNTTQCVYVPIINDDCVEDGPEVFTATLRSDDDRISFGANSTTIHIFDDDYVTIGFGQSDITVDEDEGAAHISVVIKCGCVRRDVEVNVFTDDGTATADSDYSTISTALTFTPSDPNQGVYIAILEDTTLEDPENFFVHLETSDANVKLQHNYSAITIRDNDGMKVQGLQELLISVKLSFVETDYTVDEDEGVQHVCVELTGELETSISVTVDTQPNTALVGEDFVQIWQTLVFDSSTNTTQCAYIPIINDDCVEDEPEVFTAALKSDDDRVCFGTNSTTISILDDDCVTIGLQQSDIAVIESAGSVGICAVIKFGCVRRDIEVTLDVLNGTAVAGSDFFAPMSTTLTFTPANSDEPQCVTISIEDDHALERTENFDVHLVTSDEDVKLLYNYSTITILDNDVAEVGFTMANYMVFEADGSLLVCVSLTGYVERPVVVTVTTLDGSAVAVMDYNSTSEVIEFTATGEQCVNISINMDGVLEEQKEQFTVVLTTRDDAITIGRQFATVTILESDVVLIGFERPAYTMSEEDSSGEGNTVLVCVILTGVLNDDVEVVLTTMPGSATGGVDYVDNIQQSMSLDFTFASREKRTIGPTEQCTTILFISDDLVEDDETFQLLLSTTEEGVEINPAAASVTITNNDDANITLQQSDHVVGEADGSVTVCAELTTGNLERNVTVHLNTVDGTATGDQDYSPLTVYFTFSAGSPAGSTACADIPIINNDIVESDEFFTITLSSSDPVNFDVSMSSCTITEDAEVIEVGLLANSFFVTEGSDSVLPVTVVITSGSLEREVSIRLFTSDDTATAGGDYDSVDTSVTFVSGETVAATRTIDISIINDQSVEDDEFFNVTITSATPADPVVFGISTAQVTIIEDSSDMVTIGFEQTDETVAESAGTVTIRANILSGVLERELCVTISPVTGSALGDGVDFMAESVKLTFSPTNDEVSKDIIIINDRILEDDETFSHLIESDDPAVILDPATATVMIIDDDEVCFEFDPPSYTVCEGDPDLMPRLVCVRLESGELGRDVTVTVQTEDDSALSTGDYTPITQDFIIRSGEINMLQCAPVTITDDGLTEPCERFFVTMSTDVPRVKVGNEAAVIVNDDDPLGEVCFTGDTPMVTGDTADIQFLLQGCAGVTCSLTRGNSPLVPPPQDCSPPINSSTGMTMFTLPALNLEFMLTLSVEPLCGQPAFDVTRGFRRDSPQCSLHLINKGLSIIGNTATIEWEATGPSETTVIDVFECRLDDAPVFIPCSTPFIITDLDVGDHVVTFRPDRDVANQLDCSRSVGRTLEFTIEQQSFDIEVGFLANSFFVTEGSDSLFPITVVITSGSLEREVSIRLFTSDDTATAGGDYDSVDTSVTFVSGETVAATRTININIINDQSVEDDESFRVSITTATPADPVVFGISTAQVTIIEDSSDMVTIGFEQTDETVAESAGTVTIRANILSGVLERELCVTISPVTGSALGDGVDFMAESVKLTFSPTNDEVSKDIIIINDRILEDDETFSHLIESNDPAAILDPATATVTIMDDDEALGEVCFTGDTPMVTGDTVDIQFLLQGCASVITCSLTRGNSPLVPPPQDCSPPINSSTGMTTFTLPALNREFILTLSVEPLCGQPAFDVTRGFRRDSPQCSLHLINKGLTIIGNTATIEWEATGPSETTVIDVFECRLDDAPVFTPCSTPFVISGLDAGDHMVTFRPNRGAARQLGCSGSFGRTLEFAIEQQASG